MLSGYRLMWMMVFFDLPVGTKRERKSATKFREFLLDQGFTMAQFSVYLRWCEGKERIEALTRIIHQNLPKSGYVNILSFTDKQYEGMTSFRGRERGPNQKNPEQFLLF